MSAEEKIIKNVAETMNKMTEEEKAKFAAFTAGMAYMAGKREAEQQSAD